jgi:hypothetical protein
VIVAPRHSASAHSSSLPYCHVRPVSDSGIFLSADGSHRLFLLLAIVLLASIRPFPFRADALRFGSPSIPVLRHCPLFLLCLCATYPPFPAGALRAIAGGWRTGLPYPGDIPFIGPGWEVEGLGGGRWVPGLSIRWIVCFSCLGMTGDSRRSWNLGELCRGYIVIILFSCHQSLVSGINWVMTGETG